MLKTRLKGLVNRLAYKCERPREKQRRGETKEEKQVGRCNVFFLGDIGNQGASGLDFSYEPIAKLFVGLTIFLTPPHISPSSPEFNLKL